MRKYEVWIYDSESGCCEPLVCEAKNKTDAKRIGRTYIRMWNLQDAEIEKIQEVTQ